VDDEEVVLLSEGYNPLKEIEIHNSGSRIVRKA